MARNKTVTLANKEYAISQLPMRANKEWRDKLGDPINKIVALLQNYKDLEIETGADVVGLVVVVKDVLLGGVDMIMDMLFAYSPVLASDRERIENEAYDDEAITAFAEVLKLAYPLELLLTAWNGPSATPTLQNSPSTNGKFGTRQTERQKAT